MFKTFTQGARQSLSKAATLAQGEPEITPDHLVAAILSDSRGMAFLLTQVPHQEAIDLHARALDRIGSPQTVSAGARAQTQPFSLSLRQVLHDVDERFDDISMNELLICLSQCDDTALSGIDLSLNAPAVLTASQVIYAMDVEMSLTDLADIAEMTTSDLKSVLAGRSVFEIEQSDALRDCLGLDVLPKGVRLEHSDEILVNIHAEGECRGEFCTIHRRSDHSMRRFPQHWRSDIAIMERICSHGIGHPDPDDINAHPIHGCDGCCGPQEAL